MYDVGLSLTAGKINYDIFGPSAPAHGTDDLITDLLSFARSRYSDQSWGRSILRSASLLLRKAVETDSAQSTAEYAHAAQLMADLYCSLSGADREREDW